METIMNSESLPKTFAAIDENFEAGGLRAEVKDAARYGSVIGLKRRIALTAGGVASLEAVEEVLRSEFAAKGFDKVVVGEADPTVYGKGQVAAYLDQPLEV